MANEEGRVESSLAKVEASMNAFAIEQREMNKLVNQLRLDLIAHDDIRPITRKPTKKLTFESDISEKIPCLGSACQSEPTHTTAVMSTVASLDCSAADESELASRKNTVTFMSSSSSFDGSFPMDDNEVMLRKDSRKDTTNTFMSSFSSIDDSSPIDEHELQELSRKDSQSSLDPTWPLSIAIRHEVQELWENRDRRKTKQLLEVAKSTTVTHHTPRIYSQTTVSQRGGNGVILPAAPLRSLLDVIGAVLLAWDCVVTPLQLAWGFSLEDWTIILSVCAACFWTSDVFVNFRTAFYLESGDLEIRPMNIAIHYMRRHFLTDLIISMLDWLNIFAELGLLAGGPGMLRLLKWTRLVRICRASRLVQLFDKLDVFLGISPDLLDSIKMLVCSTWLTHFIACTWFALGNLDSSDTGLRWVDMPWAEDTPAFLEAGHVYQYLSSLQWTLTTMVSGTSSILPLNSVEQIFSCSCIWAGLVGQAFVISILSSAALERKSRQRYLTASVKDVQRFCSAHKIESQLALSACWQVRASIILKKKFSLSLEKVEGLQIASPKIRMSLLQEIFEPRLSYHPLFLLCLQIDRHTFSRLMMDALDLWYVPRGHYIFMAGDAASKMLLLSKGDAVYTQDPESSKEIQRESTDVPLGTWFCEPALWTHWAHVGTTEGISQECEVHRLYAEGFFKIASGSAKVNCILHEYSVEYHKRVVESVPPRAPWPNDLAAQGTEFACMLFSMSADTRKLFASLMLECAVKLNLLDSVHSQQLGEEVQDGKASFMLSKAVKNLSVHRVVSVARFYVRSTAGLVFVRLGSWSDERFTPQCEFPGAKQRNAESIAETIERVVNELSSTLGDIELVSTDNTEDIQESKKMRIKTHYFFKNVYCRMRSDRSSSNSATSSSPSPDVRESEKSRWTQMGLTGSQGTRASRWTLTTNSKDYIKHQLRIRLLQSNNLYAVPGLDGNTPHVYAWVPDYELQFLQSRSGSNFLYDVFEGMGAHDSSTRLTMRLSMSTNLRPSVESVFGREPSFDASHDEANLAPGLASAIHQTRLAGSDDGTHFVRSLSNDGMEESRRSLSTCPSHGLSAKRRVCMI